ncbi:MAG: tetratricopeptide repeat protein [Rhodanobacteraceae bacterium]
MPDITRCYVALLVALVLALGACSASNPPPPQPVRIDHDAVAAIRAAGNGLDSAVQVHPLHDPAVDGLLAKAHAAEAARDFDAAAAATESALKLAPDAPEILQYLAELEVDQSHWLRAEQLAIKSFTLGPKVGNLCARNWQTVIEARTALNDRATRAAARERLKECRVPPPVRM